METGNTRLLGNVWITNFMELEMSNIQIIIQPPNISLSRGHRNLG